MQYSLVRCLENSYRNTCRKMNPLRTLCVMACLMAAALASPNSGNSQKRSNSLQNYEDPSNWVSPNEIEQLPMLKDVTLRRLEEMTTDDGATLLDKLCKYPLSLLTASPFLLHQLTLSFSD